MANILRNCYRSLNKIINAYEKIIYLLLEIILADRHLKNKRKSNSNQRERNSLIIKNLFRVGWSKNFELYRLVLLEIFNFYSAFHLFYSPPYLFLHTSHWSKFIETLILRQFFFCILQIFLELIILTPLLIGGLITSYPAIATPQMNLDIGNLSWFSKYSQQSDILSSRVRVFLS